MIRKLLTMLGCVLVGVALVFAFQHLQNSNVTQPEVEGKTVIDLSVLQESMKQNNELSTAKYLYTSSVSVTDENTLEAFGLEEFVLPFTAATYIFEFDGEIKAGYKLEKATVEKESDTSVVVTLPPAEMLSHETGDVKVVFEQQNIANPLKAGEESAWIEGQKAAMEERAESLGLYDEAEKNARVTFETLFAEAIPEGATLEIRFQ